MKITRLLLVIIIALNTTISYSQNKHEQPSDYLRKNWKDVATRMPSEWYGSDEARMAADSVLKYQTEIGGWPKNSGFHNGKVKQNEWARIVSSGIGATFDNGATLTEMKFLAKIYGKQKDETYRAAFMKALNYIFEAQYENGGWPQFFPYRTGRTVAYSSHITYNDNAMANIMYFLRDISNDDEMYESIQISAELKAKANMAFEKGIECILKTQIVVNGKPTVWCAQHNEFTLAPADARSYELASFSGAESVGIALLLMDIDDPSKEIIAAINGAVEWFDNNRIVGVKVKSIINDEGKKDRIVVEDSNASDLWGRFYDLETGKPIFCDRDGIKKNSLAEIGYNRRTGYSWYTGSPEKVIQEYNDWARKWGVNQ